jgi:uncharacterized membrane protein
MTMRNPKVLFLVQFSILLAILAIFHFLFSTITFGVINITLDMIPVIIAGIMLGVRGGAVLGCMWGLFSMISATLTPGLLSFVFSPFISGNVGSALICFVPRILVGALAGCVVQAMNRLLPGKNVLGFSLGALAGVATNTALVLGGMWLIFGQQIHDATGQAMSLLIGATVLTNALPEAVVSVIAVPAICKPLKHIFGMRREKRV